MQFTRNIVDYESRNTRIPAIHFAGETGHRLASDDTAFFIDNSPDRRSIPFSPSFSTCLTSFYTFGVVFSFDLSHERIVNSIALTIKRLSSLALNTRDMYIQGPVLCIIIPNQINGLAHRWLSTLASSRANFDGARDISGIEFAARVQQPRSQPAFFFPSLKKERERENATCFVSQGNSRKAPVQSSRLRKEARRYYTFTL